MPTRRRSCLTPAIRAGTIGRESRERRDASAPPPTGARRAGTVAAARGEGRVHGRRPGGHPEVAARRFGERPRSDAPGRVAPAERASGGGRATKRREARPARVAPIRLERAVRPVRRAPSRGPAVEPGDAR